MFEDMSNAIKATLYERVSSPFISSFIFSWCVFNYKILFILFSGMETRYKFYEIEVLQLQPQHLLGYDIPFYPNTFLYPFLAAVFYTLVFPFIEIWLTHVWMKGQKGIKSKKVQFEDETPVSQEQYAILLKRVRQMDRDYREDLERKDNECKIQLELSSGVTKQLEDELDKSKVSCGKLSEQEILLKNQIKKISTDNNRAVEENKKLSNSNSKLQDEIRVLNESYLKVESENSKLIELNNSDRAKLEQIGDIRHDALVRRSISDSELKAKDEKIKGLNIQLEALSDLVINAIENAEMPEQIKKMFLNSPATRKIFNFDRGIFSKKS